MALPIHKFNRVFLYLNRSPLSLISVKKITTFTHKSRIIASNLSTVCGNQQKWRISSSFVIHRRVFSVLSVDEVRKRVDAISIKFTDAVELINDAKSSMGTIYFTDDMKDAEVLVGEVLSDYSTLLASLNDTQRTDVQRTIGLKMEELKAQITILKDSIKE